MGCLKLTYHQKNEATLKVAHSAFKVVKKSSAEEYRFGYQGSEKDNEVNSSNGTSYTTEFRQLDTRLGRWFSSDPVFQPWQSSYTSMDNNPVNLTDVMGLSTGEDCAECSEKAHNGTRYEDDEGNIWERTLDRSTYKFSKWEMKTPAKEKTDETEVKESSEEENGDSGTGSGQDPKDQLPQGEQGKDWFFINENDYHNQVNSRGEDHGNFYYSSELGEYNGKARVYFRQAITYDEPTEVSTDIPSRVAWRRLGTWRPTSEYTLSTGVDIGSSGENEGSVANVLRNDLLSRYGPLNTSTGPVVTESATSEISSSRNVGRTTVITSITVTTIRTLIINTQTQLNILNTGNNSTHSLSLSVGSGYSNAVRTLNGSLSGNVVGTWTSGVGFNRPNNSITFSNNIRINQTGVKGGVVKRVTSSKTRLNTYTD